MKKEKVLFVFAHPDDELIWGWPVLQDDSFDKEIIICSSDAHNPTRKWCAHRRDDLAALCRALDIPHVCLDYDSGFYKVTARRKRKKKWSPRKLFAPYTSPGILEDVCQDILATVRARDCDYIFTHNFWGEYGHMDHILLNALIFGNCDKPIFTTDARLPLTWVPLSQTSYPHARLMQAHVHSTHVMDLEFYERCADFYKKSGTWTWSQPSIPQVNLCLFPPAAPDQTSSPAN